MSFNSWKKNHPSSIRLSPQKIAPSVALDPGWIVHLTVEDTSRFGVSLLQDVQQVVKVPLGGGLLVDDGHPVKKKKSRFAIF